MCAFIIEFESNFPHPTCHVSCVCVSAGAKRTRREVSRRRKVPFSLFCFVWCVNNNFINHKPHPITSHWSQRSQRVFVRCVLTVPFTEKQTLGIDTSGYDVSQNVSTENSHAIEMDKKRIIPNHGHFLLDSGYREHLRNSKHHTYSRTFRHTNSVNTNNKSEWMANSCPVCLQHMIYWHSSWILAVVLSLRSAIKHKWFEPKLKSWHSANDFNLYLLAMRVNHISLLCRWIVRENWHFESLSLYFLDPATWDRCRWSSNAQQFEDHLNCGLFGFHIRSNRNSELSWRHTTVR